MPTSNPLLLDTCACIWLMNGDQITDDTNTAIKAAKDTKAIIWICPITIWEISMLVERKRITLSMSVHAWCETLLNLPQFKLSELSAKILIEAAALKADQIHDPADRMIVATARTLGMTIVTRDKQILSYSEDGHVRSLRC